MGDSLASTFDWKRLGVNDEETVLNAVKRSEEILQTLKGCQGLVCDRDMPAPAPTLTKPSPRGRG